MARAGTLAGAPSLPLALGFRRRSGRAVRGWLGALLRGYPRLRALHEPGSLAGENLAHTVAETPVDGADSTPLVDQVEAGDVPPRPKVGSHQ